MCTRLAWHAEGLRWLARLLNGAADALEQPETAPSGIERLSAPEACDEMRSRLQSVPYF
jgi:hypothetical protein